MWKKFVDRKKRDHECTSPAPSTESCLADFYSQDPLNKMFQTTNLIDFQTFSDYATNELDYSNEKILSLWDPLSIDRSLNQLGHLFSLYVWLRMRELHSEEDRKQRLAHEHENFALHLPEYIRKLPTKHPEKLRDLAWAARKCKKQHLAGRFPCDRIQQYYSNPCFRAKGYNGL